MKRAVFTHKTKTKYDFEHLYQFPRPVLLTKIGVTIEKKFAYGQIRYP